MEVAAGDSKVRTGRRFHCGPKQLMAPLALAIHYFMLGIGS